MRHCVNGPAPTRPPSNDASAAGWAVTRGPNAPWKSKSIGTRKAVRSAWTSRSGPNDPLGREQAHGAYLLRTNGPERDPTRLWKWYLQLQQAEAAFRLSKSDLHLRPIFHQKDRRVEAHLLVCFLALALWRTLEQWMSAKGLGSCARQLLYEVATVHSLDVILPVKDRGELRLRVVSKPDRPVAELLVRLGLELPSRPKILENVVEKIPT
jgi:hypothetical protein